MLQASERLFFGTRWQRLQAAFLGLLVLATFTPTLVEMAREWFKHPEYGHGVLMPPVAAWMLWDRRRSLAAIRRRPRGSLLPLAAAFALLPLGLLLLLGEMKLSWFLKPFAFVASLVVCIVILYGGRGLRALAAPLLVLCLMCPIPWRLLIGITLPLKRHASVLATGLIDLSGLDASLQGNLIHVPGITSLWVADVCSGVRSFLSLLSIAILGCIFWRRHWSLKGLVILASAPIAVAVNGVRIWLTAMLAVHVSPDAAEGFFHLFEGFLLFGVAALVLLGWALVLHRLAPRRPAASPSAVADPPAPVPGRERNALAFGLAAVLLAASAFGVYRVRASLEGAEADATAVARMQTAFAGLPLDVGGGAYRGAALQWDRRAVEASGADAYGAVRYVDRAGGDYQVYLGGALRNADNFHAPNVCMPTAGWEMLEAESAPLAVYARADSTPRMQRLVLQRGGERMLTYFWFQAGERLAEDEWEVRFARLFDLLSGKPLSPTVIVSIYIPFQEDGARTEAAARKFLGAIAPYLREVITSGGIHG